MLHHGSAGRIIYVLLILPPLLWSTMIVAGRAVIGDVPPASLTFWTWLVAVLGLLPFALRELYRRREVLKTEFALLLLYAVLGVAAFQGFYYAGLERTTAVNAALLTPTLPVLVTCVAWPVVKERLGAVQILGVLCALTGALWISAAGSWQHLFEFRLGPGDGLILSANLCMACYTVLLRKYPSALTPIPFMTAIAVLGTVVLLPCYLVELTLNEHPIIPWGHASAILYIGLVTYDLGYVFWNISVNHVGANATALFLYLIPVFGTVLAILYLGEAVGPYHGVGIALIFLGIFLSLHMGSESTRKSL